jgi:nitroreductase
MNLTKPVTEIIKVRKSCRTYSDTPIGNENLVAIEKYIQECSTDNFRFAIVDKKDKHTAHEKLGTYGVIRGATTFIAGIMNKEYKAIEHFGYAFEKIVLFLTDMNIGTCWLGASFERSGFSNRLHIKETELVPIVTPLGYPGTGFNFHSTLVKWIARPDKRASWDTLFFNDNFSIPLPPETAGTYADALEMVRLGPSAGNMQPWRILKTGNRFHFYLKRSSFYKNRLSYDIQRNDIGIAMCHFELASKESGLKGEWHVSNPASSTNSNDPEYIISWNVK